MELLINAESGQNPFLKLNSLKKISMLIFLIKTYFIFKVNIETKIFIKKQNLKKNDNTIFVFSFFYTSVIRYLNKTEANMFVCVGVYNADKYNSKK